MSLVSIISAQLINISSMKRLVAAWRLVVGVWLPRDFEMPLPNFVAQYSLFAPDPPKVAGLPPATPPEKYQKPKRLSSRVLVKHILRVRAQAARELAELLLELENGGEVVAQTWLAEEFGGKVLQQIQQDGAEEQLTGRWVKQGGTRSGREVLQYLKSKGARLGFTAEEVGAVNASGVDTEME